jgi:hypothetical protein
MVACEGGTSGSVIGSSSSCRESGNTGQCTGKYRTLRGSYGFGIENENLDSGDVLQVEVSVSVEAGAVTASVETADGTRAGVTAEPGAPATLSALAAADWEELEVRFEAVDGEASGITFEIVYGP